MRTALGDRIHELLRSHVGEANFVSAPEIARELGVTGDGARRVRDAISTESALWGDMIVAGVPGLGYFAVADADEVLRYSDCLVGLFTTAFAKWEDFEKLCRTHGLTITLSAEQRAELERIQASIGHLLAAKHRRAA